MQWYTLVLLLLVARPCVAQQFPDYVQSQGNSSGPTHGLSPDVRHTLERADNSSNASHTVRFTSLGNGDWNWTLKISDVSVPNISNSTPNSHVAFTTWHFSQADREPIPSRRADDSPVCAYLMDINFPYNVSSQWDPSNSSCIPALGTSCASALSAARITDNCDTKNAPSLLFSENVCASILGGGPGVTDSFVTQGFRKSDLG
jgi:hypothetical protein